MPSNTANGVWRKDATATVGYDPVGSEFTISYGYITDTDGTEEYLDLFTGIVQDDPKFDSTSGVVTISLVGKSEAKLEAADAQNVCVTVTGAATSPTDGNGVLLAFSAVVKSIWEITNVTWNAIVRTQGTDYTLDDLNDAEVAPTINFEASSVPGAFPITFDYRRWYRDKSISELVGYLCDAAGISSGDRTIEEPVFDSVASSVNENTKAEFDAGTVITNIDTTTEGYIKRKWHTIDTFADGDLTASPAWITVSGTPSIVGGKLKVVSGDDIYTPSDKMTGTWEWKWRLAGSTLHDHVYFICSDSVATKDPSYSIHCNFATQYFSLVKHNDNVGGVLAAATVDFTSEKTVRVTRTADGVMKVYVDTVLTLEATDTTVPACTQFRVASSAAGSSEQYVDDIYYSEAIEPATAVSAATATHESSVLDMLAAPSAWATLTRAETLNGGTIAYYTATSTDGISFDAYVAISGASLILSALKRYIKIKVVITPATGSYTSPVTGLIFANFLATNLFVKSADFTGQNCLEAVQELAIIGGMEFGSNGDGTFFFRNKSVTGAADLVISQKNVIAAVTDFSPGYRDVKNVAQVRYGKSGDDGYYFAEYGATEASEASPTTAARFGTKVIEMEIQRLIFSNDAIVAAAIAQKLYELYYRPKRKLKLKCRIIPHLDLSDQLAVSFHDSPLIEKAIFGDPLQRYPVVGPNSRTLARDITMKVVGHSPDIMRSESVLDLEEVLT